MELFCLFAVAIGIFNTIVIYRLNHDLTVIKQAAGSVLDYLECSDE